MDATLQLGGVGWVGGMLTFGLDVVRSLNSGPGKSCSCSYVTKGIHHLICGLVTGVIGCFFSKRRMTLGICLFFVFRCRRHRPIECALLTPWLFSGSMFFWGNEPHTFIPHIFDTGESHRHPAASRGACVATI